MKTETGEHERLHQAFVSLAETARPTADCPDPQRLWAAPRGELPPGETREMIEHTASCPACAEAWRLAMHLFEEVPQVEALPRDEVARRRTVPAAAPWWRYAAAAAAVVVAVFGVSQMTDLTGPERPVEVRGAGDPGLVSSLPEDEPLPRDAFVLRWRLETAREGVRYRVQVRTADLQLVTEGRNLEDPFFQVPEPDLAELPSGTELLWQVTALLADGEPLISETFVHRLE